MILAVLICPKPFLDLDLARPKPILIQVCSIKAPEYLEYHRKIHKHHLQNLGFATSKLIIPICFINIRKWGLHNI